MDANEYGGVRYTSRQQMVEAMVWDYLSGCGRHEEDARSIVREAMHPEADGGEYLADEIFISGWMVGDGMRVHDRADISRGDILDALAALAEAL